MFTNIAKLCLGAIVSTVVFSTLAPTFASAVSLAEKMQAVSLPEGEFVIIGDQWIDRDQFEQSEAHGKWLQSPAHNPKIFGSKPAKVELWEDGVLPIQFKKDVDENVQAMVWMACAEWAEFANIRCQKGKYKNRVLTVSRSYMGNSAGCWSMLGSDYYFMSVRRRMNLGYGCEGYPTILHEMGHALGITHEHQRMDRDDFVDILDENVEDSYAGFGKKLNFEKQKGDLLTEYDFFSIMHYDRTAFSKNGKDTIVPKENFKGMKDRIGKSTQLSEGDIFAIRALYGPREEGKKNN